MRTPLHAALASSAVLAIAFALAEPDANREGVALYLVGLAIAAVLRARGASSLVAARAAGAQVVERFEANCADAGRAHEVALGPYTRSRGARDELLSSLAHELKTPLNSIRGFADVLLDEVDGALPAGAREEVEVIKESGAHLHALIDEVLDAAAGRATTTEPSHQVSVAEIVAEVVRSLLPRANDKGLRVRVTTGAALPLLDVNPNRVRQILLNLVANAIKYTEEGEVTIHTAADAETVSIAVMDTGPGIAASDRERIFSDWERATSAGDGHGLGLAIARDLTTSMGARLELESELGRGATFRLAIPIRGRVTPSGGS